MKTTQEPTWAFKKVELCQNAKWILSRDWKTRGAKQFASFPSYEDMVLYLEAHRGHALYEIVRTDTLPCFLYFDIDGDHHNVNDVADCFLTTLKNYLESCHSIQIDWVPGMNCQLSNASTSSKASLHFVGYIRVETVAMMRLIAVGLVDYILREKINGLLYSNKGNLVCAVDDSVYSKFRSFRCLHMEKEGKRNYLKPFRGSSENIADHFVNFYEGISPPFISNINDVCLKPPATIERKEQVFVEHRLNTVLTPEENNYMNTVTTFLTNSGDLKQLLKCDTITTSYSYVNDGTAIVYIDKQCCPVCPYANRVHSSNNICTISELDSKTLTLHCYNTECTNKPHIRLVMYNLFDTLQPVHDALYLDSLHTQQHLIPWTHDYCLEKMKPYPNDKFVCIRAGMGLGKTVALKEFIQKHFKKDTTAIVVTFSRNLARKYHEDLDGLGFVNYQEVEGTWIQDSRVIVCLDSLWRVTLRNPCYVFVDEALSIFSHFNSPLMRMTSDVTVLLELLLWQSKHTFFLDACIDHSFLTNVVKYFTEEKPATWIINRFVRKTNRKAFFVCSKGRCNTASLSDNPVAFSAIQKVLEKVRAGKKVVVCSSTKKFTTVVSNIIRELFPDKKVLLYNSDTQKNEDSYTDTSDWDKADVLVYSPSITAGVSFEKIHFDCLVSYFVNSNMTPGVDISLQQLFRVRQLRDGEMYIFVMDSIPDNPKPVIEKDIEYFLENDSVLLNKYFSTNNMNFRAQQRVDKKELVYDKNRLSFQILKGILTMQNRSAMFFTQILKKTLEEDYGIPCEYSTDTLPSMEEEKTLVREIEDSVLANSTLPPFTEALVITGDMYEELSAKEGPLTPLEKIQRRVYDIGVLLWKIDPEKIDKDFYDNFVVPKGSYEKLSCIQRFMRACQNTVEEVKYDYSERMMSVVTSVDSNMELFKQRYANYYMKTIVSMDILNALYPEGWREGLKKIREKPLQSTEEKLLKAYDKVFDNMKKEEVAKVYGLFNVKSSTKKFVVVKRILEEGLGMVVDRNSNSSKRGQYKDTTITLPLLKEVEQYHPKVLEKCIEWAP